VDINSDNMIFNDDFTIPKNKPKNNVEIENINISYPNVEKCSIENNYNKTLNDLPDIININEDISKK